MVFEAMIKGWANQQRGGRGIKPTTIKSRAQIVRRFHSFTTEYPWNWTPGDVDEWMTTLISEEKKARSTVRHYQDAIRQFCDFITSPLYHWADECEQRFKTHPVQVCHEWNTLVHLSSYEGHPGRRSMTRGELQRFFDYADNQVEKTIESRRKGALAAYRDATILKVLYAWGLRVNEACQLDLVDLHSNPKSPEFGNYGAIHVRFGKSSRGQSPKRRTVLSVMPWAVEALRDYAENVRPRFGFTDHPSLWVTERGGRLRPREVEQRFADYRRALRLPKQLTPHCLRHSYVTHLVEDGTDTTFVQNQVGHAFASTTAVYTNVSSHFMNTMMRTAIERAFEEDEGMEKNDQEA